MILMSEKSSFDNIARKFSRNDQEITASRLQKPANTIKRPTFWFHTNEYVKNFKNENNEKKNSQEILK